MKRRIEYLDLAKGINICLVVLFHTVGSGLGGDNHFMGSNLSWALLAFLMPSYFFMSGFFFRADKGFMDYCIKKINRLIVPLLAFVIIGCFPWRLKSFLASSTALFSLADLSDRFCILYPTSAIWFLIVLFFDSIFYYLIYRNFTTPSIRLLFSGVFSLFGLFLSYYGIKLPLFLDVSFTCLFFYALGYYVYNHTELPHLIISKKNLALLSVITILTYYLLIELFGIGRAEYAYNGFDMPVFWVYIYALLGTFILLVISQLIGKLTIISFFGENSIVILCTHQMMIKILHEVFTKIPVLSGLIETPAYTWCLLVIVLAISVLIIKISKYTPYIYGQKNLIPFSASQNKI